MKTLLVALFWVLILANQPVLAQIAVDNAAAGGTADSVSSLTFSYTVNSNTNGVLTVCAGSVLTPTFSTVTGVTYNGVAMTLVKEEHETTFSAGYNSLWILKAPATGAHNVVITFSASSLRVSGGAVSFTGVDQTTPQSNAASAQGASTSSSTTVTSVSGSVVTGCAYELGSINAPTSGNTQQWSQSEGGFGDGSGQATASGAASVNMTWTWGGGTNVWVDVATSLNAASGGATAINNGMLSGVN